MDERSRKIRKPISLYEARISGRCFDSQEVDWYLLIELSFPVTDVLLSSESCWATLLTGSSDAECRASAKRRVVKKLEGINFDKKLNNKITALPLQAPPKWSNVSKIARKCFMGNAGSSGPGIAKGDRTLMQHSRSGSGPRSKPQLSDADFFISTIAFSFLNRDAL
jgi:hypothetical protein